VWSLRNTTAEAGRGAVRAGDFDSVGDDFRALFLPLCCGDSGGWRGGCVWRME
jgi:hypothetical protein